MYVGYQQIRQRNPRETCNVLSFLTFAYTIELFKKGIKGNLQESDIYEVSASCNSKRCGDKTEREWKHCETVIKLLWKRFGLRFMTYTSIHMTWLLINSTIQPYAMSRFISYFEKNQTQYSKNDAYFYGGIVIFLSMFRCIWIQNYYMLECILGIQIRSSLTSLIYRKLLRLQPGEIKGSSMGSIVTILTKDIRTVITTMWPLSDFVIGTVQYFYLSYLLYSRLGLPSLIPVGILAFAIFNQGILSQFVLKMRLKAGKMADKRLQFTREVISFLKIIKMYSWEIFFQNRICGARKKETKANLKTWFLGTVILSVGALVAKMVFPIFLLSYISFGHSINTELVYYIMSVFKEMGVVVGVMLPSGFALRAECYASIIRIGRVLNMDELRDDNSEKLTLKQNKVKQEVQIDFQNASVVTEGNMLLKNISMIINEKGLYILTGSLGSGKSSILKAILGEYVLSHGHLNISGTISYASQDPWLFPASVRQNILFGQQYNRKRYNKTIRICSLDYDLEILPNGDNTIITDGGLNLSKGQQARVNLARAIYKDCEIYLLDDPLAGLDVKVQEDIFNNCIRDFLNDRIVVFVTQNSQHLKYAKKVIVLDHGEVKSVLKPETSFREELENTVAEALVIPTKASQKNTDTAASKLGQNEELQANIYHENKNIGKVDLKNYYSYIKYGGGVLVFTLIVCVFFCAQFTESYADKLISVWVNYQQDALNNSRIYNNTIYHNETKDNITRLKDSTFNLYIIMIGVSICIDLIKSYIFLAYCRRASVKFHKLMCQGVINCVMPFLDNHFIGNILNRFSYDLDHIDEVFPFIFMELIKSFFAIGGTLILIMTVNWIFLFVSILFFITLIVFRRFYIPTARAIKRLGAITRSPFIGHLNATVEGLSTIKAFKAEDLLKEEFDRHQDLAISATFMETTTSRAFGYALDFNCAIFIALVISTFLFLETETTVGNIGLALTQVIALSSNLQWIIRAWAELEQCMTSVERVVEYSELPQEDSRGEIIGNKLQNGKIEYRHVSLKYNFKSKVLKDVSFMINPREKVGIVGRTGAGKSSIISTLFRLYDYQGHIRIDDTDIATISSKSLRRNVSIIPQDTLIFEDSLRANIDPYQCYPDTDIWNVLKNVGMDKVVEHLDANILDLSLSTGQKQLLCFARALLQNNKIVVMDEPTANLDKKTDILVRSFIKEHFVDCTVIMIAHRLNSVLECNRVMVMDNGSIIEFDNPTQLLQNKQSRFYQMMNIVD